MTPAEAMERISNRWYAILVEWLKEPDYHDHYLMRIAFEVACIRASFSKSSKKPKLEDFKLQFKSIKQITQEQQVAFDKARWMGMVGMKPRIVKPGEPVPPHKKRVVKAKTGEKLRDRE